MSAKVEIIVAGTEGELERCLKLRNTVFTVERGVPREIEVDEFDCLGSVCDHVLIEGEGRDVGALRCMHMDDGIIKLQRFCVLKDCRGRRYGRIALGLLEGYYRRKNVTKLVLDSKFEASGFYEKCGYMKVSKLFEEAGVPHIKMEKSL
ncbi:MAG: GNAT family N-acetyltransferase [Acetatifactor sp.]|nr:GNAT family N-acetyltransferase [Acetatifactor sp.]